VEVLTLSYREAAHRRAAAVGAEAALLLRTIASAPIAATVRTSSTEHAITVRGQRDEQAVRVGRWFEWHAEAIAPADSLNRYPLRQRVKRHQFQGDRIAVGVLD